MLWNAFAVGGIAFGVLASLAWTAFLAVELFRAIGWLF